MTVATVDTSLFCCPQSFLRCFALRLWQLFAVSFAPKLQLFPLTNASWK